MTCSGRPRRACGGSCASRWSAGKLVGGYAERAGQVVPALGGVLATALGWRSVFLLNVPVGAAAYTLTRRYVPVPAATRAASAGGALAGLDVPAQVAAVVSLAGLATALNEAGSLGWASPVVAGALAASAAGLAAFLLLERRSPAPMLPLAMFRAAAFSASAAVGMLLNIGFYGLLFVAPLYFERVHGYTPLRTGFALLPAMGLVAASSAISGRVTSRTGPRLPMVAGTVAGAAGLFGWLAAGPGTGYLIVLGPTAAAAAGVAFTVPASTAAIMAAAPDDRGGAASAVFNAARQAGTAIGVAMFGTLAAGGLVNGLHAGVVAGGAGFLAAAALTAAFIRPVRRAVLPAVSRAPRSPGRGTGQP